MSAPQSAFLVSTGTVIISLSAFPLLYFLDKRSEMDDSFNIFLAGIIFCFIGVSFLTRFLLQKNSDIFFYVFSVFAFSAVVDLDIAMTLDNVGLQWINFYLQRGEPYLCSSYGSAINWWDGTVHYLLYIFMTGAMAANKDIRWSGFFWVGSIMNSLMVFLPGNVIGKFSPNIQESYFLNVPYVLFPLIFMVRQFRKSPPSEGKVKNAKESRGFILSFLDFVLVIFLIVCVAIGFFRAFVASRSPIAEWYINAVEPIISCEGKWPMLQLLAYVYFYVPFYIYAIYCLIYPQGKTYFPDLVAIHAGAAMQAQFSYMYPALHQIPGYNSTFPGGVFVPVPLEGQQIFWAVNTLLIVLPLVLFLRVCFVDQSFWARATGKTATKKTN